MSEKNYKNDSKLVGNRGEDIASDFLVQNGYEIIDRNFRCRQGEIDIIAKDKKEIVFIEVKTRRNKHFGSPIESVTFQKKKHIIDVAKFYLYINNLTNNFIRFDIIEIYISSKDTNINHIKNVFLG